MSTPLEIWRDAYLALAPLYGAYLYAKPAERTKAHEAYIAGYRSLPRAEYVEIPRPEPVWVCRPPEFPAGVPTRVWRRGRGLQTVELAEGPYRYPVSFNAKGLNTDRKRGRNTRHRRLNVLATERAYDKWARDNDSAARAFLDIKTEANGEMRAQAVRSGTGWLHVWLQYSRRPEYLVRCPETATWRRASNWNEVVPESCIKALIEVGPPPRAAEPTMTWAEVHATLAPLTCSVGPTGHLGVPIGYVRDAKGRAIGTIFGTHGESDIVTCIGEYGHEVSATPANLRAWVERRAANR